MVRQRLLPISLLLPALLVIGLLCTGFRPGKSSAAHAQLPPRPTVVPTPIPTATAALVAPRGVRIRLTANPHLSNVWSVVQWQGGDGVWHDVGGWRGETNRGVVSWWATPKDFGTGPFRWVIEAHPGGPLLGVSPSFFLPSEPGETLHVTIP